MKKTYILLLIFALIISGCVTPKALMQEEAEKVFEHKVSLSKSETKQKTLQFISENFKSAKAAMQVNDEDLTTINFDQFLKNHEFLGIIKTYGSFTFMVKYTDGGYKLKVILKDIYNIDNDGKVTKIWTNYWGNYTAEIEQVINSVDKSLLNYINTNDGF